MKVMILGGGVNQIHAIKTLKHLGHHVIVSDYTKTSPGKQIADTSVVADTFCDHQSLEAARQSGAEAILVTATDQPVLTAARVCQTLGLPFQVDVQTAYRVTNKEAMKACLQAAKIPTLPYVLIDASSPLSAFEAFSYPAVLKPVDSQGQRGIYKVDSPAQALLKSKESLTFSRVGKALLEDYYPNTEVTVSGWVAEGQAHVLTLTDRVTFDAPDKLGICVSHDHPSRHLHTHGKALVQLSKEIVDAFNIRQGPFYFQFLVGQKGLVVNEIACRIGGAHEDQFIKRLTGFDLLKAQIDLVTGQKNSLKPPSTQAVLNNTKPLTVQLFFAQPGTLQALPDPRVILNLEGVLDYGCHDKVGDVIPQTQNASARAGYVIIEAEGEEDLIRRLDDFNKHMVMTSTDGRNLYLQGKRGKRT